MEYWERVWACLLKTLKSVKREDLGRTALIRGGPHSVPLALERSLGHTCYHVGQIVQVARIQAGEKWNTLTIPTCESCPVTSASSASIITTPGTPRPARPACWGIG